jgi:colanic acid biosynthesis glycosyl transferase WcaI
VSITAASNREMGAEGMAPLLFVNAHYYPDVHLTATASRLTDLAEYLAAKGHAVEVLCGPSVLSSKPSETRNGVRIHRIRSTHFGKGSTVGRILDYLSFVVGALALVLGPRKFRGIVFLTTPPLLGVLGWLARRVRRRNYAIWSMDLHPDAEVAAGMLRERSVIARLLFGINYTAYRHADFVIALGTYMRERIVQRAVAPKLVHVVPMWVGEDELHDETAMISGRVGREGSAQCVVGYIGNAGIAHDFRAVLEAMRELRHDLGIRFLFVGGGAQRPVIERFLRDHDIRNATYQDYVPRKALSDLYGQIDVHLVTLKREFAGIAVPTKCYSALASGAHVLFVGPQRSESADAVSAAGSGVIVDPSTVDAVGRIVSSIRQVAATKGGADRSWSTDFARTEFGRDVNCARIESLINQYWRTEGEARQVTPQRNSTTSRLVAGARP